MKKKNIGVTRKHADKLLTDLCTRAEECFWECKYNIPYYPTKILVFGSYMGNKKKLGDLDVFIEKKCKWKRLDSMFDYYQNHPMNKERSFMARLAYADNVFYRFIKNRSTSLSMHNLHELEELKNNDPLIKYETVWELKMDELNQNFEPEWMKEYRNEQP